MEIKPYKNNLGLKNKIARIVWNITYYILFRPFALPIFNKWRIYILRLFGAKIGNGCQIKASAKFWAPWNLVLKDFVAIGQGANLYSVSDIIIGNKVTISQRAYICTASHDITTINKPLIKKNIYINNYSWIAAEAFIGPGVTIGEGAVVGARAAVFKDVEPWCVVGGNPAVFLKKRVIKEQC